MPTFILHFFAFIVILCSYIVLQHHAGNSIASYIILNHHNGNIYSMYIIPGPKAKLIGKFSGRSSCICISIDHAS